MILILKHGTTRDKVDEICNWLQSSFGVQTSPIFGEEQQSSVWSVIPRASKSTLLNKTMLSNGS